MSKDYKLMPYWIFSSNSIFKLLPLIKEMKCFSFWELLLRILYFINNVIYKYKSHCPN